MMVGEIAFEMHVPQNDEQGERNGSFSSAYYSPQGILSQLVFIVFLILVPIIMMNLLIALAISNITSQFKVNKSKIEQNIKFSLQLAGVYRLRMTVLLIRTLGNLVTVARKVCPCCMSNSMVIPYLKSKQATNPMPLGKLYFLKVMH